MHAPGVTPDRVLFIGSGAVVGYGVLLHELSISGEVARQASQVTDRGMDVDIIAAPNLDIAAASLALRDVRIARYDAIVLMLGPTEVMNLYRLTLWRRNLTQLLEWLAAEGPASLQILVVGAPAFERIVSPPLLKVFAKHCHAINRITESVVEGRRHVTFVALEPDAEDFTARASRHLHVRWASYIVPSLVAALSSDAPVRAEVVDEGARLAALLRLNLFGSTRDDNIQDLVDAACGMLDASGASFNLIDRDRHWVRAAAGLSKQPVQMPRSESFCAITIEQSRLFVIEDMTKDPLYRDKPFVTGPPGLRFYAGYPVEAPHGHRIGSLCIIDTKVRTLTKSEATMLRNLALRVQAMLWERLGARAG